jgi:hypothetical protein
MDDLRNQIFGRLTAIKPVSKNKSRNWKWLAYCSCGNEIIVSGANLSNGHTKSCGCFKRDEATRGIKERSIKHGASKTRLYKIWCAMRRRCNAITCDDFKWYGAKGIKVCPEWDDYSWFMYWSLSNGYGESLTIDRIDSMKGYSPENCQWITNQENVSRSRREKVATGKDVTKKYK